MLGQQLHLHLRGYQRQGIFGNILEVMAHLGGCHLDILCKMFAHELHHLVVFHQVMGLLAYLRHAHIAVFLEFLLRARSLHPLVDLRLHIAVDLLFGSFNTVDLRLMQEQLLDGQVLRDDAVGITRDARHLRAHFLHVAAQDGLIANHPDDLIHHIAGKLCKRRQLCSHHEEHKCHKTFDMCEYHYSQCLLTVFNASWKTSKV